MSEIGFFAQCNTGVQFSAYFNKNIKVVNNFLYIFLVFQ